MAHATKEAALQHNAAALIFMTTDELLRVCSIAKDHAFQYTIPLARIVERIMDYSIRTVEAWELIDLGIDGEQCPDLQFDYDFDYLEEGFNQMIVSLRYTNHERDTTEILEVDVIQMITDVLKAKSPRLMIEGAAITQGQEPLMVEGKALALKDGVVRVAITTERPE